MTPNSGLKVLSEEEARKLAQGYSFLWVAAEPCVAPIPGWCVSCACIDGQTRRAYSMPDISMLYQAGLIRVK